MKNILKEIQFQAEVLKLLKLKLNKNISEMLKLNPKNIEIKTFTKYK